MLVGLPKGVFMRIALHAPCFEGVDPEEVMEGYTGVPRAVMDDPRLSLSSLGLLLELIAREGDFDVEAAKLAEAERRAGGALPESVDDLLGELVKAGYISLPGV